VVAANVYVYGSIVRPVVVYKAIQQPSISSITISRLMLNLRDPSLVLNRRRASFITSSTELTYPITTIAEVEHSTQLSEGTSYPRLAPFHPQVGRSHMVYN